MTMDIAAMIRQAQQAAQVRLGIGIVTNREFVSTEFALSLAAMEKPDINYLIQPDQHLQRIEDLRNDIVRKAKGAGCTHLVQLDVDQFYYPDTITRLLSHNMPIVGALICRRTEPYDPLMFRGDIGHYASVTEWLEGELVEVDATGTGCLLVDMKVFDDLQAPYFYRKDLGGYAAGEDVQFCADARKRGYRIFVDTAAKVPHKESRYVTVETWKQHKKITADERDYCYAGL